MDFNFKNRDLSGTDVAEIMPQFKKEKEKNIYLTLGIFCAGHYSLYLIKTKGGGVTFRLFSLKLTTYR